MIFYAFTAVYGALLAALLVVAYRPALFHRHYTTAKAAASIGFLALCFAAALPRGNAYLLCLMLPGLLLCAAGDVLLALANRHKQAFNKLFLVGTALFALAHAAFAGSFSLLAPVEHFWQPWMVCPPALITAATVACTRSKRFRLEKMKLPAIAYAFFVGVMCTAALRLAAVSRWSRQGLWFAAGALLFVVSDCILLFLYFYYKPRKLLRLFNLLTYYLAMLCFAAALAVPLVG